jgi:phenylacetate-CoA ligase
MDREQLYALQLTKLKETVKRVYERVPFYKQAFDAKGIKPEDIRTLEDVKLLPFTVKQDLRDNYPFGLFSADMDDIVRIHASSGTTGKPTVVGYTRGDIDCWTTSLA